MSDSLPLIYLVRHGETQWSRARRHTGRTDLPLTEAGSRAARRLGQRLRGRVFARVLTSPLQRAARTCELAGLAALAQPDRDLLEWDYGDYEGLSTAQIRAQRPRWNIFHDGCPGGESPQDVAARVDRVLARLRLVDGNVILFSSAHLLRVLAVRWLGLEPTAAALLVLDTSSVSILGYEHDRQEPAVRLWNDIGQFDPPSKR